MPEPVSCEHFEDLAVLYALGELEAPVRAAVEEHARACPACAALLQREAALAEILASGSRAAPSESLPTFCWRSCRSHLNRTIDDRCRPRPPARLDHSVLPARLDRRVPNLPARPSGLERRRTAPDWGASPAWQDGRVSAAIRSSSGAQR